MAFGFKADRFGDEDATGGPGLILVLDVSSCEDELCESATNELNRVDEKLGMPQFVQIHEILCMLL